MATVVELIRYAIKGRAGTPCDRALPTPAGLAHDRTFMVVDADGVFRPGHRHQGGPGTAAHLRRLPARTPGRGGLRRQVRHAAPRPAVGDELVVTEWGPAEL